ncbi:hypothetical protein JAAARDRAFT_51460 [Jaapia argillacea MUCL 33604]|uniref:Uncharacterized protein n=1 Tax=Jaapia argillacea MUCL 33604 TaxID=933084 RepID=A0A067P5N1_9AGAM|nr:hypothetical protein JAAARDRAFT_51460 [Jaapia argillacea MUCL 33604]
MSCKKVLEVPELQSWILKSLRDVDRHWTDRRWMADLVSVVCSSRLWHSVALGMIWGELDSVDPLLKLIPELEWSCDERGNLHWASHIHPLHPCIVLKETHFTLQKWREATQRIPSCQRFDLYAARVPLGIDMMVERTRRAPDIDGDHFAAVLPSFLANSLERLDIEGIVPMTLPVALAGLFESLRAKCPFLKAVKLTSSWKFYGLSTMIEPLARSLPELQSIWLSSDPLYQDGLDAVQGGFRSLRSLRLDALTKDPTQFFDTIAGRLRSLTVAIRSRPVGASIPTQIACLARLSNLTRLWIFLGRVAGGSNLLEPLFALNSLTELRVLTPDEYPRGHAHFLPTEIGKMAQSWPWLRSLIVLHPSLAFDLHDIRAFAAFANLRELRLGICSPNWDANFCMDPEWKSTSHLVIFDLVRLDRTDNRWWYGQQWSTREYGKAARYIRYIFPFVQPLLSTYQAWGSPLRFDFNLQCALYDEIFGESWEQWAARGVWRSVYDVRVKPDYEHPDVGSYRERDIYTNDRYHFEIEYELNLRDNTTSGHGTPIMFGEVEAEEVLEYEDPDEDNYRGDEKTEMVMADKELRVKNLKSGEEGDVRVHLNELRQFQEKLANAGKVLDEKQYRTIMHNSITQFYSDYANALLSTITLISTPDAPKTVMTEALMNIILQKFENQRFHSSKSKQSKGGARAADGLGHRPSPKNEGGGSAGYSAESRSQVNLQMGQRLSGRSALGWLYLQMEMEDSDDEGEGTAKEHDYSKEIGAGVTSSEVVEKPVEQLGLYDSGATQHICIHFNAHAGWRYVDRRTGDDSSPKTMLSDVLLAPNLDYSPISWESNVRPLRMVRIPWRCLPSTNSTAVRETLLLRDSTRGNSKIDIAYPGGPIARAVPYPYGLTHVGYGYPGWFTRVGTGSEVFWCGYWWVHPLLIGQFSHSARSPLDLVLPVVRQRRRKVPTRRAEYIPLNAGGARNIKLLVLDAWVFPSRALQDWESVNLPVSRAVRFSVHCPCLPQFFRTRSPLLPDLHAVAKIIDKRISGNGRSKAAGKGKMKERADTSYNRISTYYILWPTDDLRVPTAG